MQRETIEFKTQEAKKHAVEAVMRNDLKYILIAKFGKEEYENEESELFFKKYSGKAENTEAEAEGWECLTNGDHYCPACQI